MKTQSLKKLALIKEQSKEDVVKGIVAWQEAKGLKVTDRDKQALNAGFDNGWRAAINMIQLHDLK